jgi:hypothetical protein
MWQIKTFDYLCECFCAYNFPVLYEEFYLAARKNNSSHFVNISITVWVISSVHSLLACPACYSLFICNSIFMADFSTRIHFPLPKFSDSPLYLEIYFLLNFSAISLTYASTIGLGILTSSCVTYKRLPHNLTLSSFVIFLVFTFITPQLHLSN